MTYMLDTKQSERQRFLASFRPDPPPSVPGFYLKAGQHWMRENDIPVAGAPFQCCDARLATRYSSASEAIEAGRLDPCGLTVFEVPANTIALPEGMAV